MRETYPIRRRGAGLKPMSPYGLLGASRFPPPGPDCAVATSASRWSDSLAVFCAEASPVAKRESFSSTVAFTTGYQAEGAMG